MNNVMEHHIVIEGTSNPNIKERIGSIDQHVWEIPGLLPECFLYKVHEGLRTSKTEAYKPMLVSIGPYHHQNPEVRAMEEHKLRYLRSLLKRTNQASVETYYLALDELEEKARRCYVDQTDHLSKDEFVEMMLLDGCFIIEYFHKIDSLLSARLKGDRIKEDSVVKDDSILKVEWMVHQICVDLVLLENQIPYFVLLKLYDITLATNGYKQDGEQEGAPSGYKQDGEQEGAPSLRELATKAFQECLSQPRNNFMSDGGGNDNLKHLLHLLHNLCTTAGQKQNSDTNEGEDHSGQMRIAVPHPEPIPRTPYPTSNSDTPEAASQPLLRRQNDDSKAPSNQMHSAVEVDDSKAPSNQMRSAVELQEAGVTFEKNEGKAVGLFDVKFHNGSMEIPSFTVDDSTETLFRNLIAYEEHYLGNDQTKYFTDFAIFMDGLINSEEDVELLRLGGIIENLLGDDKRVSDIFTKLAAGVFEFPTYHYSEVRDHVNDHCKKRCSLWMATLRGKYFNNPWAGISTIAAGVLLLLAFIQTIVAILTLTL